MPRTYQSAWPTFCLTIYSKWRSQFAFAGNTKRIAFQLPSSANQGLFNRSAKQFKKNLLAILKGRAHSHFQTKSGLMDVNNSFGNCRDGLVCGFDLSQDSSGELSRCANQLYQLARLLIPAEFWKIKMGRAKRPVQELRLMSGSSWDLRSLADRFLRTADPQVLIS